jgi:CDP-diacylglycerol--glycerol-3-phosphate 3-phosphatidyltransferase
MLERQVEERALVERHRSIESERDAIARCSERERIGFERARRAAADLSGELIRHDDERETSAWCVEPRGEGAARGIVEERGEATRDFTIERVIDGEPTATLRRARKTIRQRAEPEIEHVLSDVGRPIVLAHEVGKNGRRGSCSMGIVEALRTSIKQGWERLTRGIVERLAALGVTPNQVSFAGLVVTIASAPLFALGWLSLGAWIFAAGSVSDSIDGALARRTGANTQVGAFIDSTFDRIGEAAALAGVAIYLARHGSDLAVGAIVIALLGGSLTSYVRARAETLGIECSVGWISRTERVFIMGILLVVHLPELMAYVLAVATCFTAGQRIVHVRSALLNAQQPPHGLGARREVR